MNSYSNLVMKLTLSRSHSLSLSISDRILASPAFSVRTPSPLSCGSSIGGWAERPCSSWTGISLMNQCSNRHVCIFAFQRQDRMHKQGAGRGAHSSMKAVRLGGCDVDRGVLMTNERANTLLGIRRDARAILCYQEREVCVFVSVSVSVSLYLIICLIFAPSFNTLSLNRSLYISSSLSHTHKVEGADSCA